MNSTIVDRVIPNTHLYNFVLVEYFTDFPRELKGCMTINPSLALAQRIGILGGTFDPVHWGHLVMAETAQSQAHLDVVIWIPTSNPHYKRVAQPTPLVHRLAMVQRAIADHPHFTVSTDDEAQTGRSFAIDTLVNLQDRYPDRCWFWIIGTDALQTLPKWYRYHDLITRCVWLIAPRSGHEMIIPPDMPSNCWQLLHMPLIGLSSSLIRQYVQQGQSIRYLVPDAVRAYITAHRLYQPNFPTNS